MRALLAALLCALFVASGACAQPRADQVWVGAWASSQQIPEDRNALPNEDLTDATLRQIVRLSVGGSQMRVRISNRFGAEPLRIGAAHVARAVAAGQSNIVEGTDHVLTFSGRPDVTVPAGADYFSDPIDVATHAFDDIAVSLYLPDPPSPQTSHPGSRTTSFFMHGNNTASPALGDAKTIEHWYQLAGIDVTGAHDSAAIAIIGDSITDGRGSTTNQNDRWPDFLMHRLQDSPRTRHVAVLNHGVGGNRLLNDGLGPNALARFDRDILTQTRVRYVIVYEGVNDLGTFGRDASPSAAEYAGLVQRMIGAYEQMIARAHEADMRIYGATIMAYGGSETYKITPESEAARRAINTWIRAPGHFDAIIDFDVVTRDPAQPDRLLSEFDIGDHLHPSPAGFRAMADAVPLTLFAP